MDPLYCVLEVVQYLLNRYSHPIKEKLHEWCNITDTPYKNKFKKIENVNNVVRVTCDPKFLSFGFMRDDIDLLPLELPQNDFSLTLRHYRQQLNIILTESKINCLTHKTICTLLIFHCITKQYS